MLERKKKQGNTRPVTCVCLLYMLRSGLFQHSFYFSMLELHVYPFYPLRLKITLNIVLFWRKKKRRRRRRKIATFDCQCGEPNMCICMYMCLQKKVKTLISQSCKTETQLKIPLQAANSRYTVSMREWDSFLLRNERWQRNEAVFFFGCLVEHILFISLSTHRQKRKKNIKKRKSKTYTQNWIIRIRILSAVTIQHQQWGHPAKPATTTKM